MIRRIGMTLGLAALAATALSAQGSDSANVATSGAMLFQQRCAACHDERGFGTRILSRRVLEGKAELVKRDNLAAPFVVAVVRNGLASMPPIREAELDDAQLALIAAYLETGE